MPKKTQNAEHFKINVKQMSIVINSKHFTLLVGLLAEATISLNEDSSGVTPAGDKVTAEDIKKLIARGYLEYVIVESGTVVATLTPKSVAMVLQAAKLE